MSGPARVVVVLRDPDAPLHYLRCQVPCRPEGWCMGGPGGLPPAAGGVQVPAHCYLGGASTESGARLIAERAGYVVATPGGEQ